MSETLLGVIIGGVLVTVSSILVEWIRASRAAELDKDKRRDDRQIGSDAFQRENLLELQERLAEWLRALGQIHLADLSTLKKSGKIYLLPEGVSDSEFEAHRRVSYLSQRVLDHELRQSLTALRSRAAAAAAWQAVDHENVTETSLESAFQDFMTEADAVNTRLGEVLRAYL